MDTLAALEPGAAPAVSAMTLEQLTTVLYLAAGVTKKKTYPGGAEVLFRAAASTGALYQTEVYVVAGAVQGLEPGLYHFYPGDFALRRLRAGDVRAALADVGRRAGPRPPCGHTGVDGDLLAQRLEVPGPRVAPPVLGLGHDAGQPDRSGPGVRARPPGADRLRRRRGQPTARPRCRPRGGAGAGRAWPRCGCRACRRRACPRFAHEVMPLSTEEVDYPSLREMQRASMLASADEVQAWRAERAAGPTPPAGAAHATAPGAPDGRTRPRRNDPAPRLHTPLRPRPARAE